MGTTKSIVACLAVIAFFALGAGRAIAGPYNCANPSACGFSTPGVSQTTYFNSAGVAQTGALGAAYTMTETEYQVATNIYAYAFELTDNAASTSLPMTVEYAQTGPNGSNADEFNPNYNFGVITGSTTPGVTWGIGGTNGDGFTFGAGRLQVQFSEPAGNSFTFYAEGTGPILGGWLGLDGVTLTTSDLGPASAPEPGVLTLLGSLLFALLLGTPLAGVARRRMRFTAA